MAIGAGSPTQLCQTLGFEFTDQSLLTHALTHASAENFVNSNTYERLEFLGDRVLGLVVCDFLMRTYPFESVGGDLTSSARVQIKFSIIRRACSKPPSR